MMTDQELAKVLATLRRARELEQARLKTIRTYLRNEACDIYVPKEATAEYRMLVDQARFNVLPLVVKFDAQDLAVSGYRSMGVGGRPPSDENAPIWDVVWQPNRLDSRQRAVHRSVISYGSGWVTILPASMGADQTAKVDTWSPYRCTALYADECNDEWPEYALTVAHPDRLAGGPALLADPTLPASEYQGEPVKVKVWDATHVYTVGLNNPGDRTEAGTVLETIEHNLGVCPVVRFWDPDEDGCSPGRVEPLIPVQRQINQTTFGLLMTQQFQAFRQRWATGMAIEEDEDGNPKQPWNAAVNAVWQNESPDGKFGDFAETSLDGYLTSRDKALLFVTASSQIPPHNMVVGNAISNISAEALAALQSAHDHSTLDLQDQLGESWEQVLRVAAKAAGDQTGWMDTSAQVVWADRTPRSLAQVADALGKLATLLEIPPEGLWERIPGVTDQDIERWRAMAADRNPMTELRAMLDQPTQQEQVSGASEVKAQADAMGVLIRAGVDPESAAAEVGLDVQFTGAVPTSLRLPEPAAAQLEQP